MTGLRGAVGARAIESLQATAPHNDAHPKGCIDRQVALFGKGWRVSTALGDKQSVWAFVHGRLDYLDEVFHGFDWHRQSHAELVAALYRRDGAQALARLEGDFCLALWDARVNTLHLARDPVGMYPLYYAPLGQGLVFATALADLPAEVRTTANPGFAAELISLQISGNTETLYRGVSRLGPGQSLRVRPGGQLAHLRHHRYPLELRPRLTMDDAADELLSLMQAALSSRLRAARKGVGAYLSGGIDSSSIVALAAQACEAPLQTFSMVFPNAPPADERPYIDAVVNHLGLVNHRDAPDSTGPWAADAARAFRDFPGYPNGVMNCGLRRVAHDLGIGLLLGGCGGDDWFAGASRTSAAAERLAEGEPVAAMRLAGSVRNAASTLIALGLAKSSRTQRALLQALRRRVRPPALPDLLAPGFARQVDLVDRLLARTQTVGTTAAQTEVLRCGTDPWQVHAFELDYRFATRDDMDEWDLLLDPRIATYALSLPERLRFDGHLRKLVLRHAMRGRLPERVRLRPNKASFGHVLARALAAHGAERTLRELAIAEAGWVDQRRVNAALERSRDGQHGILWQLWTILGLELWYRACF